MRIGRGQNDYFTTGTGVGQPKGILTGLPVGLTCASATAILADEIVKLIHSVNPAYRVGAGFMMHDNTLLNIRLLKDGNGQYIWQSGLQQGEPDKLLSYALTINMSMASTLAANNIPMIYGQLKKHKVRDAGVLRLRHLVERYADQDEEGFVGFLRSDSNTLDAGTHPIKAMQLAAS